jgi:hypothetical protein
MGYADDDGTVLRGQLNAWKAEVLKSPLASHTKIVVIAGNHEVNKKVGEDRKPNWATTSIWREWIKNSPFWDGVTAGPTAGAFPEDQLPDDQETLNGTIDIGTARFILINTDCNRKSQASTPTLGYVPNNWIRDQLLHAQEADSVKSVFVIGHKNLLQNGVGDAPIESGDAKILQSNLEATAKFKGFLCSHVHAWYKHPFGDAKWQIIEGRGGSKLEKNWTPTEGRSFGFTVLDIDSNGDTIAIRYDRPEPAGKYFDGPGVPAVVGTIWKL